MIGLLMATTAEVVTYGEVGRDRLDRPVQGEVSRTPARCRLEQTGSSEGSEFVAGQWIGYFAAGTALRAEDRVVVGDRTFAVDGQPDARSIPGFPALSHVVAHLTIVGG